MPQWATFAGFAIVVTAGLLLLSHASRGVLEGRPADGEKTATPRYETDSTDESVGFDDSSRDGRDLGDSGAGEGAADHARSRVDHTDRGRVDNANRDHVSSDVRGPVADGVEEDDRVAAADEEARERDERGEETVVLPKSGVELPVSDTGSQSVRGRSADDRPAAMDLSTASLLANVVVSQGLFGVLLVAGAWYAEIPAQAFGIPTGTITFGAAALGVGLGLALYAANEAAATAGARFGLGEGERLRSALAPDSKAGWAVLLFVVLPVIAGFEELLFRGALVGVLAAGYDVSPWLLALLSSVAFGFGHGAQGRIGVLVTGALGFVLAAAFVATGNLFVVVIAHYLVNALEFVVHEGLGLEWPRDAA